MLTFKFKFNLEPFRWRTVTVFPWSITLMFLWRYKTSKYWKKQTPEVFFQKVVLENFLKFIGNHLCKSLLQAWAVSCEFWEIFKNTFFVWNTSSGCFCADLLLTSFYSIDHFVLLGLKLKPSKCLISVSKLSSRWHWKFLQTLFLTVNRLYQHG